MRGLGGNIVGAARIINSYKFREKKNIIPSPLMKKDPVQFHRFFFSAGEKRAPKFKKIY